MAEWTHPHRTREEFLALEEEEWGITGHFPMGITKDGVITGNKENAATFVCFICPEEWPCERSKELGFSK